MVCPLCVTAFFFTVSHRGKHIKTTLLPAQWLSANVLRPAGAERTVLQKEMAAMDQQAQECFEPITEQMKQAEGVTEELKGRGQMAQRGKDEQHSCQIESNL